jgi:hypothetical protein
MKTVGLLPSEVAVMSLAPKRMKPFRAWAVVTALRRGDWSCWR